MKDEPRELLRRIVKYAREDRATTPGTTRLARALAEAESLLARAEEPDITMHMTPEGRAIWNAAPRADDPQEREGEERMRAELKQLVEKWRKRDTDCPDEVETAWADAHETCASELESLLARAEAVARGDKGEMLGGLKERRYAEVFDEPSEGEKAVAWGDKTGEKVGAPKLHRYFCAADGCWALVELDGEYCGANHKSEKVRSE